MPVVPEEQRTSVYRLADVVPITLRRFSSQVGNAFSLSTPRQPPSSSPTPRSTQRLYITTEICRQSCDLQAPAAPLTHHIYVSLLNIRADELAADLSAHAMRTCPAACPLTITQRPEEMVRASQFLLLLSEETFDDPSRAEEIGYEVAMAVEAGLVRRTDSPPALLLSSSAALAATACPPSVSRSPRLNPPPPA